MPEPSRRPQWTALAVAGWLAAVAVATGLTIGAVSLIGVGLFGGSAAPLSEAEVNAALAAAPEPSPTQPPSSPATASPSPTSSDPATTGPSQPPATTQPPSPPPSSAPPASPSAAVAFSRAGNTVVARCGGGTAQIVSWSPAQGYQVPDGVKQHGDEAEVEFESGDSRVRIRVSCVGDQPTAAIEEG